ncbi:MAG: hypothetical protein IID41_16910 [Planctomycetes bacterium]|nr:hypothetical protein [Planctomycetota bacterium]
MNDDYFTILGLTPGRYKPRDITRSFQRVRTGLIAQLGGSGATDDTRRKLDRLHLAYNALREPDSQAGYQARNDSADDAVAVKRLIAASLEDGLLRFSRRQMILEEGRRRGFSGFQTQLLIAQVQFGDDRIAAPPRAADGLLAGTHRTWPHLVAIGLLAVALFLILIGWVLG